MCEWLCYGNGVLDVNESLVFRLMGRKLTFDSRMQVCKGLIISAQLGMKRQ